MTLTLFGSGMPFMFLACISGLALALALWSGRAFARADDAQLAERWVAHVKSVAMFGASGFVAASLLTLSSPALAAPLFPLFFAFALYPARRRVLDESWSLGAFVAFQLRWTVALGSTWFAIALLPELVRISSVPRPLGAVLGAAFAFTVMVATGKLFPRLLGAAPLADDELLRTLAPVIAKARCAKPSLFVIDPKGGRLANALALPSPTSPRVLFGRTLLDHLSSDEIAAILGHELAHLEHYDRRYLRRLTAVMSAVIVLAAVLTPIVEPLGSQAARLAGLVWPFVVMFGWLMWMSSRQSHEGDCDVRGVEIAGRGEAMISALTKLHGLARIPRQLAPKDEAASSHPSLERRIAKLRAAMGETPAPELATATPRDITSNPWATLAIGLALVLVITPLDAPLVFLALGVISTLSRGHRPTLHAVAAACACYLALLAIDGIDTDEPPEALAWLWIAGVGALAALAALRLRRTGPSPPASRLLLVALGIGAVPSALLLIVFATMGNDLHFAVRNNPSLPILCAALAGALGTGSHARRIGAGTLALLVLCAMLSTTTAYSTTVGSDPFFTSAPRLMPIAATPEVIRSRQAFVPIGSGQLSPSGRWALVGGIDQDADYAYDEAPLRPYELRDLEADPAQPARSLGLAEGDSAMLVDDQRALLLQKTSNAALALSVLELQTGQRSSTVAIPIDEQELLEPLLTIDREAMRYRILTMTKKDGTILRSGRIGEAPDSESAHDLAVLSRTLHPRSPIAIGFRGREAAGSLLSSLTTPLRLLLIGSNTLHAIDLHAVTARGDRKLFSTRVPPQTCVSEDGSGKAFWCLVQPARHAQIVRLETERGAVTRRYTLPKPAISLESVGPWLGIMAYDTSYLLNTQSQAAYAFDTTSDYRCTTQALLLPNALGVFESCEESSFIRLFALPRAGL